MFCPPIMHDRFGVSLKKRIDGQKGDPERVVWCESGYDVRKPLGFEGGVLDSVFNHPGSIYYPKMAHL